MFRISKKSVIVSSLAVAAMGLFTSRQAAFALPVLTSGNSTLAFNPQTSNISWIVDGVDQFGGTPAGGDSLAYFNGTGYSSFSTLTLQSSNVSGNIGTAVLTGAQVGGDNFTITVSATLQGGAAGSGASAIAETIEVDNNGPAQVPGVQAAAAVLNSPVDFIVTDTFDANLNATPNDDTLLLSPGPNPNTATQTDPTGVKLVYSSTPIPTQYSLITNGAGSTGLGPQTGNEAFMFGWDLSLAPGDSGFISITDTLSGPTQTAPAVPLPSSAGMTLGTLAGLGLLAAVRKNRRSSV